MNCISSYLLSSKTILYLIIVRYSYWYSSTTSYSRIFTSNFCILPMITQCILINCMMVSSCLNWLFIVIILNRRTTSLYKEIRLSFIKILPINLIRRNHPLMLVLTKFFITECCTLFILFLRSYFTIIINSLVLINLRWTFHFVPCILNRLWTLSYNLLWIIMLWWWLTLHVLHLLM